MVSSLTILLYKQEMHLCCQWGFVSKGGVQSDDGRSIFSTGILTRTRKTIDVENFWKPDLMDKVLPGLNNVARHIRPFVVVTWAWRRAKQLAEQQGRGRVRVDQLRDFVDRIEVIYAWSQFLLDPQADLPGSQVLSKIARSDRPYRFGGVEWKKRCEDRRNSTALTAPINYGPGLKTLGWVEVHEQSSMS